MRWNRHYAREGQHAFLSPSGYAWIRYDEERLVERWVTSQAAKLGTVKHDLAHQLIKLKQKLPKTRQTLNMFVNDVIGLKMQSEQTLFYSDNCFGTADAIGFKEERGAYILRVFDLKTGVSKASVDQLLVYAALFCLEYDFNPEDLLFDLRIYQNDEIQEYVGDPKEVFKIMQTIKMWDKKIEALKAAEED